MLFFGFGLVSFFAVGFWLFALFDVITAPAEHVRNIQKPIWVLIVLLGFEIGAVFWFFYGRPRTVPVAGPRTGITFPNRSARGSMAPDDDIDFLRSLKPKRGEQDGPVL